MITRCILILAGLFVVGIVGAFLLYVSVLSLLTAIALMIGLVGTLFFGYWAGSHCAEQLSNENSVEDDEAVISSRAEGTFFPSSANVQLTRATADRS